jgi:transcriptional regulator with XRE-family HTH domain
MTKTRGERLRLARKKLYSSASSAAAAMGIPAATYGSHERAESSGGRDYGPEEAQRYARRFGVTAEWLLVGKGEPPKQDPMPEVDHVTVLALLSRLQMIKLMIDQSMADLQEMINQIPRTENQKPDWQPELREGGFVPNDPEITRALEKMNEHFSLLDPINEALIEKLRDEYRKNLVAQIVVDKKTT